MGVSRVGNTVFKCPWEENAARTGEVRRGGSLEGRRLVPSSTLPRTRCGKARVVFMLKARRGGLWERDLCGERAGGRYGPRGS